MRRSPAADTQLRTRAPLLWVRMSGAQVLVRSSCVARSGYALFGFPVNDRGRQTLWGEQRGQSKKGPCRYRYPG